MVFWLYTSDVSKICALRRSHQIHLFHLLENLYQSKGNSINGVLNMN